MSPPFAGTSTNSGEEVGVKLVSEAESSYSKGHSCFSNLLKTDFAHVSHRSPLKQGTHSFCTSPSSTRFCKGEVRGTTREAATHHRCLNFLAPSAAGIPNLRWYGIEGEYNVMVIDLLGPSLEDLFNFCSRKFSVKTVIMLADQMVSLGLHGLHATMTHDNRFSSHAGHVQPR